MASVRHAGSGDHRSRCNTRRWANEIADLVNLYGGGSKRLAIDIGEPKFIVALHQARLVIVNAERMVERAAAIKSADELHCIAASVAVAERGLAKIHENLQAGVSEQALWAHLAYENAQAGGGWFEYSILIAGERTNPWGRECSHLPINAFNVTPCPTRRVAAWAL